LGVVIEIEIVIEIVSIAPFFFFPEANESNPPTKSKNKTSEGVWANRSRPKS
jgi:hypothetical protein